MSHQTITELEILADVIAPQRGTLHPDVARTVLKWKFPAKSVTRMNRLAELNSSGKISSVEREELERFLRVGSLINLVQSKARLSLTNSKAD